MLSAVMRRSRRLRLVAGVSAFALLGFAHTGHADDAAAHVPTESPIKHVVIIIGENRTFDHAFATYVPRHREEGIWNLLSRGIVNADGTPGPNFSQAQQFSVSAQPLYYIHAPATDKTAYNASNSPINPFPNPDLNGVPLGQSDPFGTPFKTTAAAAAAEPELTANEDPAVVQNDLRVMTTGFATDPNFKPEATSLVRNPDFRIFGVTSPQGLANGPFQMTAHSQNGGPGMPYDSYHEDTIHRFFQMWQQMDCDISDATPSNPSGCQMDLLPFVDTTANGSQTFLTATIGGQTVPLFQGYTGPVEEGSGMPMAFTNVQQGDMPFFKRLADEFTISDNMHQAFIGGTGPNHVMIGTGDVYFFNDGQGNPAPPPAFPAAALGLNIPGATVSFVANPNPTAAAQSVAGLTAAHAPIPSLVDPNLYTNDVAAALGEYVECADTTQPGVTPIVTYLKQLSLKSNCAANTFYAVNNIFPGFHPDGTLAGTKPPSPSDPADFFFLPPQTVPTIGDALQAKGISWHYYGDGFNTAVAGDPNSQYCPICNPMQYSESIMTGPGRLNNKDVSDFFTDLENDTLPSVSFIKPSGYTDGHPQSSKTILFEAFTRNIIDAVDEHPEIARDTAIMITWDEGGGLYDSGYIQPLDFFGDGPRIPFIIVSSFTRGGHVNHSYADHVSMLKFIERNWGLNPLSARSRDNLPNPETRRSDHDGDADDFARPYIPVNGPAISDLFDMFHFDHDGDDHNRDHDDGDHG